MLQVAVTTVRVLPLEEDKVPNDGAVKVGQVAGAAVVVTGAAVVVTGAAVVVTVAVVVAVQVGVTDHALMILETTPLQVIELEPVSV